MTTREHRYKSLPATYSAKADGKGFTATITTDVVDRDGEVLIPDGMNAKEWEQNPLLCWLHDVSQPVGKGTALRRKQRSWEADFEFALRPEGYVGEWFPDYARGMVEAGVVRGVSVGFWPMKNGVRSASQRDREMFGEGCKSVISMWKLFEVSLVPMPANQEALISAVRKGYVTRTAAAKFGGVAIPEEAARPKRVISVVVPRVGSEQRTAETVRREIARAKGLFFV